MTKESLEHLSSLMDGELSRDTSLFMARRLSSDAELGRAWKRYHLIRDCLRQPGGGSAVFDLSERMRAALDSEPERTHQAGGGPRWLRPATGLAIAASVAVMAIVAVGPGPQAPAGPEAGRSANTFTSPNVLPAVPVSQPASFAADREAERRLNSYLLRHNQLAGSAGRQGFVSFVPIISTAASDGDADERSRRATPAASQAEQELSARP
jgi:sigma-E factor negative regulatory protein RseA